jgi:non-ribosomal peptide synthetase component F
MVVALFSVLKAGAAYVPLDPGAPLARLALMVADTDAALLTVAPVTTRIRRIPTAVGLGLADGLPKACVIHPDTITTIPAAR